MTISSDQIYAESSVQFNSFSIQFNFIYNITHNKIYKKYSKYTNNKMILKDYSKGQKRQKRTPPIEMFRRYTLF